MMISETCAVSVVGAGAALSPLALSPLACAQLGNSIDLSSRRDSPSNRTLSSTVSDLL
jgi:hypothetical protein